MSQSVLSHLLRNVAGLPEDVRLQVLDTVRAGQAAQALTSLDAPTVEADRTSKAWGALQLYLLHLNGEYEQANRVLDSMVGMDLSQQLCMDNCPTEAEIMARWDSEAEGVSILCTTFNHARFIGMALASFFSQVSTHPFEVIVRDDASTDGTTAIVSQWQARYPQLLKLELLSQNTYCLGTAPMPAALEKAHYPLVAMCEGDDFWVDPEKMQCQAQLLSSNPSWAAVFHNHFELDEGDGTLKLGRSLRTRGFFDRSDLLNVHIVLWVHTVMFRKSKLQLPLYSHRDGILGDQVLTSMLGMGGAVYYQGDLVGSVARRNLLSTYTPLVSMDKQMLRIKTKTFLARQHLAMGNKNSAAKLQAWSDAALKKIQATAVVV